MLCGRIKDVIIVGGRNVFPEDIERAVGRIDGVRAGNVIAFGVEGYKGKETVVVVAEVKGDDLDEIRRDIHHRALEVCGVPPRDVMLVRARHPAEDVVRQAAAGECREHYLDEELALAGGAGRLGRTGGLSGLTPPAGRPAPVCQRSGSLWYGA